MIGRIPALLEDESVEATINEDTPTKKRRSLRVTTHISSWTDTATFLTLKKRVNSKAGATEIAPNKGLIRTTESLLLMKVAFSRSSRKRGGTTFISVISKQRANCT
jgi:hypothetical protein